MKIPPQALLCLLMLTLCVLAIGCGQPAAPTAPENSPSEGAGSGTSPDPEPAPAASEAFVPSLEIAPDEDFEVEEGFTRLSIDDFLPFEATEQTWQQIDGVIVCSGDPKGYLHSRQEYQNFTWRAEYRFMPVDAEADPPPNTGFMIHIQDPHKVWPNSLEVQGRWDTMCSINPNGGAAELTIDDDPRARESARKPVGEWNAVEIVSRDGGLTATLNGELICTSQPGELTEGLIGLQSELFEVHFRRLRIRVDE